MDCCLRKRIRSENMRFRNPAIILLLILAICSALSAEDADNHPFQPLFNGRNLSGWTTNGNWLVQPRGILVIRPRAGEKGWQRYADYLWTNKPYENFVLQLEYKIPKKGNSGIFLGVKDKNNPVYQGLEIQILDSHEKKEPLTPHDCGGVIGIQAPQKNAAKPFGTWNQMVIVCQGNHLQVELNGEQVIDLDVGNKVSRDKPLAGYIGLQDHGLPLEFRKIRIKQL